MPFFALQLTVADLPCAVFGESCVSTPPKLYIEDTWFFASGKIMSRRAARLRASDDRRPPHKANILLGVVALGSFFCCSLFCLEFFNKLTQSFFFVLSQWPTLNKVHVELIF